MTSGTQPIDEKRDTLEAGRIIGIGSHFTIDLDETLCQNGSDFLFVQGVLETISDVNNRSFISIPKEKDQWKRFSAFMRTWRGYNVIYASTANVPLGAYFPESFDKSQ